jgi:hypothetical protein
LRAELVGQQTGERHLADAHAAVAQEVAAGDVEAVVVEGSHFERQVES